MVVGLRKEPFFFVRHGRTDWSRDDITKGPGNYSLNENGREDAKKAANIFASMKEDWAVISSELVRAHETAQFIAKEINTSVNLFPNLHERYFGDFRLLPKEGCTIPPDAEPEIAFKERIFVAISSVMNSDTFYGKKKVIVSHGLVFKQLSLSLTGEEQSIGYGEIFLFTPSEDGNRWITKKVSFDGLNGL